MASAAFSQDEVVVIWVNCNQSGLDRIMEQAPPGAALGVIRSRESNKGRGNGGESINVTVQLRYAPLPPVRTIECIKTADEDAVGTWTILAPNGVVLFEAPLDQLDPALFEGDPGRLFP
jgi:hypothetical protein